MKKCVALSIFLFVVICGGVFAQSRNPVTWAMAVYKYSGGSNYQDYSPQRSISMVSGDEFYIYVRADSPGYFYIVQENTDRTSSFLFSGPLAAGKDIDILEDDGDFVVPAGTGVLRFHIVVSSSPQQSLERYNNQSSGGRLSGALNTALNDEITRINRNISTVAEAPEKPVTMGGGVRGKAPTAYQYEGQDTYVKTITIRH